MRASNLKKRFFTSIILFFLIYLIFNSKFFLVLNLIIMGIFSLIEFLNLIKRIFINKIYSIIFNVLFTLYIFTFCSLFLTLSDFFQIKVLIFTLLMCCIISDISGFVVGKSLQGPKLTKISPNKTISGAIGSIVFTSIFLQLFTFSISKNFEIKFFIYGSLISIASQLGDLFFSYLKRKAKVKDTGRILPGHGGLLDRLDGIYFALPVGLFLATFLTK